MRLAWILVGLFCLAGCTDAFQSKALRECAEASVLAADTERKYSQLLQSDDPAYGPIHEKSAAEAVTVTAAWKKRACRN